MVVVRFMSFILLWVEILADQTHFRISSLDPIKLDSFKTSECGDIVYEKRVIGNVGNWSKYEVITVDEIVYLENGTLFHRFTHSPSYDHPLAHNVSCFTFDRLSRRIVWVDAVTARLNTNENDEAPLLPDCLDIATYAGTTVALHANHTVTLNNKPIAENANELPQVFFVPCTRRYVIGEVGQYTIMLYSISLSFVLVFRFILFGKGGRNTPPIESLLPHFSEQSCKHDMKTF